MAAKVGFAPSDFVKVLFAPVQTVPPTSSFSLKLAVIVLLEFITIVIVELVPVAPVQFSNSYPSAAVATIVTLDPLLYCPELGVTVPPALGLADVVKVYFTTGGGSTTTGSSPPDEHEKNIRNVVNREMFLIIVM